MASQRVTQIVGLSISLPVAGVWQGWKCMVASVASSAKGFIQRRRGPRTLTVVPPSERGRVEDGFHTMFR